MTACVATTMVLKRRQEELSEVNRVSDGRMEVKSERGMAARA